MGKNDFTEMRQRGQHSMQEVRIPSKEERDKAAALERQKAKGIEVDLDTAPDHSSASHNGQEHDDCFEHLSEEEARQSDRRARGTASAEL
jgi:hypothetical protein